MPPPNGRLGTVTGSSHSIFRARGRHRISRGADRDQTGKVCALCALSALSTCPDAQAIANARKKARSKPRSYVEARRFSPRKRGSLRLEPSSTSDKRDDISATRYVLAGVPLSSCVLALWTRLPRASARRFGVSQIVKTAQSRGRLSAPCFRRESRSLSRRAPSQAAPMLRKAVFRHFDVTYSSLHPGHHADKRRRFPVAAADARVERAGARPSSA